MNNTFFYWLKWDNANENSMYLLSNIKKKKIIHVGIKKYYSVIHVTDFQASSDSSAIAIFI